MRKINLASSAPISKLCLAITVLVASMSWHTASQASAVMNTCNNSTYECRANVATVYSVGNTGFVVLSGHLIPSICTGAAWGYYWSLDLTGVAARARFNMAMAAYMAGQPIELRTADSICRITTVGMGE
jgi:hypothetical protein